MNTDTPRTDVEVGETPEGFEIVNASFARQLERELNEANATIKRLIDANEVRKTGL